ncbi:hypothetical protein BKA80DRAFT_262081 [Phyllosticta citrichinensis]
MAPRNNPERRIMAEPEWIKNGDTEESSSEDEDEDDQIKTRFEKLFADLTSDSPRTLKDVLRDHDGDLKKNLDDGDNFLHFFIAQGKKKGRVEKFKPLLNYLIKHNLDLMKKKGGNGKTPLQLAIKKGWARLVEAMCNALNAEHDVDEILFNADSDGDTCLHEAMRGCRGDGWRIAFNLIGRVNDGKNLRRLNRTGLNPLHIAVEYDRCTPSQLHVVRKLIDTCDEALDANLYQSNPRRLSVYRYHEKTRLEHMQKQKSKNNPHKESDRDRPNESHSMLGKDLENSAAPQAPSHTTPSRGSMALGKKPEINAALEIPLQGVRRVPTAQDLSGVPSMHDKRETPRGKKKVEDEEVTEESANEIKDLLKLRFMMNPEKDHDAIVSFLYNPIQQKNFCFSLVGGRASLGKQTLEENLRHVQFEDTLQHVELPYLEIEKPAVSSKFAPKAKISDGMGRHDYVAVFEWLRKKGVRRIINLSVNDRKDPAHSEEAIEESLQGIEVIKLWDWQKPDLSSETIFNAAKNVEQVCLYWNGNNAILRSWSEPEGLSKLKNLAKVTIVSNPQGLESRGRTQKNLIAFSERLKSNIRTLRSEKSGQDTDPPELEVIFAIDLEKLSGKAQGSDDLTAEILEQPQDQHRWITCMEEYADFIQGVRLDESGQQVVNPVKVALIDDGYDISEPAINDKVVDGRSFCQQRSRKNYAPYFVNHHGHGTIMANQICRVCPKVELFMFRLDEHVSEQGKRQITAKSAVQAVHAAISMGVDIISMSWTIERTEDNKEYIEQFQEALRIAAGKNILLFCACPDQGADSTPTYPAASELCARIGAAKASGEANQWVRAAPFDFLFPGDKVVRDRHGDFDRQQSKCRLLTGSSVATALAAGFGALVLYCVRFAVQHATINNTQEERVTTADLDRLKTRQGMGDAFQAIGMTPAKYLEVWNVFESAAKAGNTPHNEDKRKAIVKVAKRLTETKKLDVLRG